MFLTKELPLEKNKLRECVKSWKLIDGWDGVGSYLKTTHTHRVHITNLDWHLDTECVKSLQLAVVVWWSSQIWHLLPTWQLFIILATKLLGKTHHQGYSRLISSFISNFITRQLPKWRHAWLENWDLELSGPFYRKFGNWWPRVLCELNRPFRDWFISMFSSCHTEKI